MPIFNQPNLAALQAAIVQAVADSQAAIVNNSDSNAAAVVAHVTDETDAAATALAGEIAAKATATQAVVDDAATATQAAVAAKGVIKSIQRGAATIPGDGTTVVNVTISAVNLSKAVCIAYARTNSGTANGGATYTAALTTATNLQVTRGLSVSTNVEWQVVEYE